MNAETQLKVIEHEPPASATAVAVQPPTAMERLERAVALGLSMDVFERWELGQARRAFNNAIADAKAEIPVITKNRQVGFDSKKPGGARTDYKYEDLAEIARVLTPILGKHGLSYRFRTTSNPNEPVRVTCIVSHRDGYFEENTLSAPPDNSGNKNSIQAVMSTCTYLERYTLKASLGLAASDDDDGRGSADTGEVITKAQADNIRAQIKKLDVPEGMLLGYLARFANRAVTTVDDIPARLLDKALHAIGASRAAKAQAQPAKPAEDMTDFPDMPADLRRAPQAVPNARAARR